MTTPNLHKVLRPWEKPLKPTGFPVVDETSWSHLLGSETRDCSSCFIQTLSSYLESLVRSVVNFITSIHNFFFFFKSGAYLKS